jgi:hypothetical protein
MPQVWAPFMTAFGRWPMTHVLGLPEHASNLPTGMSGAGFLPDFVAAATIAAGSLVIALIWSLVDRRRLAYPRVFAWEHAIGRYMLAALLLLYGYDKVLPGQFGHGINMTTASQPVMMLRPIVKPASRNIWFTLGVHRRNRGGRS